MAKVRRDREVITITTKAHDTLKQLVAERESNGCAASILSVASEIIMKAGDDAEKQHILG